VLATGFVLPLSVSTVKVSLTVGVPLKVIFLAHIFGLHVSPGQMVPIEGVVVLEAIDLIPDIFKTLVNVTADLSMATLLSRAVRSTP